MKKLSELIHSSTNYQNLEDASVEVHFAEIVIKKASASDDETVNKSEDEESFELVEDSEFIVSRTVNKSSNSTYYIDGEKSTFTEVTNLLKSKGIDLENNRFLILQGEVEQISLMKPKAPTENEDGLLEYIEDIIGTNKYVEKIEQALVKVEELNDRRTEKLNRVKSSEKEKQSLEGPMNEALSYLRKRRELVESQHVLVQKLVVDSALRLKQKEEEYAKIKSQHEQEKERLLQVTEEISKKEEDFKNSKKEQDKIAKQLQKKKDKFTEFENKDEKFKEDLKSTRARRQQLEKNISSSDGKREDISKKIEDCKESEDSCKKDIAKFTPELEVASSMVDKIYQEHQKEIKTLCKQKEDKQKQLAPFKQKENEIKEKIALTQSEINMIKENQNGKQNEYEKKVQDLKTVQGQLVEKKEEISKRRRNHQQVLEKIKEEKEKLLKMNETLIGAERKVTLLTEKYSTLKSDQQNNLSQNRIVQALVNESNIPGVCGRLGDLGSIDPKYDVAVSTACGMLNCIVVETTESAKKCVEYLKKNGLGVATFIMLDKIKPPQSIPSNVPEGIPRLFDLITPVEERFKSAFFYGVQHTLVANDLEQASRIAYSKDKRWRVVSLKGDLIEEYGTMSGGGKVVMKGQMTLTGGAKKIVKISEKDIKEAKANLDEAQNVLIETQKNRQNMSQFVKKLEYDASTLDMSVKEASLEVESIGKTIGDLEKQVAALEKELQQEPKNKKDLETRLTNLNSELEEFNDELETHRGKYKSLEKGIEGLTCQIENVGDGKLKKQKELVESLTRRLDDLSLKLDKSQVQRESNEKTLKKLESQLKSDQEELSKIGKKIEDIETKRKQLEEEATPILEDISNLETELKTLETQTQEKEKEFESSKKQINKMREKEVELKNSLEDCSKEMKEVQKQHNKRSEQMENYEKAYDLEFAILFELEAKDEKKDEEAVEEEEDKMDTSDEETKGKDGDILGKSHSSRLTRKTKELLEEIESKKLSYEITILETELEKMKPNLSAIEDFKKKEEDYKLKYKELEQVTLERNKNQILYEDLRRRRLDEFMRGFSTITMKLKEIYQMITLGGDAELELVDSLDPFSEGIVFSVRPPKKSWKNISNLSGGEKTLSSLALVFALHHFKPTPIYVMDEIDAALDFRNVSIVANYVKERTKNDAQFIIISLRNNMFELANILVGIYKTNDVTKSITVNPHLIPVPGSNSQN